MDDDLTVPKVLLPREKGDNQSEEFPEIHIERLSTGEPCDVKKHGQGDRKPTVA